MKRDIKRELAIAFCKKWCELANVDISDGDINDIVDYAMEQTICKSCGECIDRCLWQLWEIRDERLYEEDKRIK